MRKPLTDGAAKLVLDKLDELAPGQPDAQREILKQSVVNGWAGVFPLKAKEAPEPPASYDVEAFERDLLYGKIEYKRREQPSGHGSRPQAMSITKAEFVGQIPK